MGELLLKSPPSDFAIWLVKPKEDKKDEEQEEEDEEEGEDEEEEEDEEDEEEEEKEEEEEAGAVEGKEKEKEEEQETAKEFVGLVHFLSFGDDEERSSAAESAFFRFSLVGSATLTRPSPPLTGDCVCP